MCIRDRPEATVTALQEQLAAYGEDCNGDGKVVVKLNQYTMAFNSEDSDAYLDMAGTTKLSTDIQMCIRDRGLFLTPASPAPRWHSRPHGPVPRR